MSDQTKTPTDLTIRPRDAKFRPAEDHPHWWVGGDLAATAVFNALSATFPHGERFFMDAVRRYAHVATSSLREQVAAFLHQEAVHSREHVAFNQMAERSGYDIEPLIERAKRMIDFARKREPIEQLAGTCALEHFTAILAHELLADPRYLAGAPAEARDLWRWHAMEEIEHKAVAFDVLTAATADWTPLQRWRLRCRAMIMATVLLFRAIGANIADLFRQDGANRPSSWLQLFGFLIVSPGLLRRVMADYFTYYRPGFHPWDHDDRELLAEAERDLGYAPAGQAA
ncbi:hypothetical protein C5708_06550 [Caulobacter sp. CCUG 60055]|uniref:metal-dependent hydrolase n=1 Tax=Caulobacter sp. CCUG 60055 TaxID=2100090 RepID=UPI001FA7EF00|nr:metal-dependent hydrolase [Caulobacter sp. CCUG 60055]MBQ1543191.1 metal-dependent hydrolase [Caulobacteraceae bacterium]MCI3179911.1 hypothetical protein [Caulobacter sp. CCUG 60055]